MKFAGEAFSDALAHLVAGARSGRCPLSCGAWSGNKAQHTLVALNPTGVAPGWPRLFWLDSWKPRIEELHTEQVQEPSARTKYSRLALGCCPSDATRAACPGAPLGFRQLVDMHFLAQSQR